MELRNKVIVITGAARGLGAAMAKKFAAKGAKLALVDLRKDDLTETSKDCKKHASEVRQYGANVAIESEVVKLFETIVADLGTVDGLVNNAGITRDALLVKFREGQLVSKMSLEQWQSVIDVNLTGVFMCSREAAQHMFQNGTKGIIVNISSISRAGNIGQTNYSATKAGVHAMAVTWAKELARYGIRAASVAPGFINTEMVAGMKPEARDKLTSGIPARRMGEPEEIAAAVEFIIKNDYISGRIIEVDGALRL